MVERFSQALDAADVQYVAETYAGAAHGWMVTDFPTFDAVASERGWCSMLALSDRTLRNA
jgi:carboxymethylenebutenolidase